MNFLSNHIQCWEFIFNKVTKISVGVVSLQTTRMINSYLATEMFETDGLILVESPNFQHLFVYSLFSNSKKFSRSYKRNK